MKSFKWRLIFTLLTVASWSQFAQAGGARVGNGGHGVRCFATAESPATFQFLDFYEAEHEYGFKPIYSEADWVQNQDRTHYAVIIDSPDTQKSVSEFLNSFESDFSAVLPEGSRFLSLFADASRLKDRVRLQDFPLKSTGDLGDLPTLAENCQVEQIAFRSHFSVQIGGDELLVSRELWNQLSNRDRALLLFHESLHNWALYTYSNLSGTKAIRQLVAIAYGRQIFGKASAVRKIIETGQPATTDELR